MKVPFFELKRLYAEQRDEIDQAIAHVLESGWYILGKSCEAFEGELARSLGAAPGAVVGCNSGTDALVLAMIAAGVGSGDEVIVPSHTAIPTITAIRSTGAEPRFAEIDPQTWVLDPAAVEASLTPRTKAIIAVHLYGNMVAVGDLKTRLAKAGRSDVALIEDVAQAQGSVLNGHQAGTIGRLGCYSFYPSKNIGALGDGGAVIGNDAADARALRTLRNYGQVDRYNAELARGLNSRLDELQAAVLSVRLKRLDEWNRRKESMTKRYREALSGLPLRFQSVTAGCTPAWHLCVIALESREARDGLMAHLKEGGMDTIIHYPIPTHLQRAFASDLFPMGSMPVTESLAGSIVSLPMNAALAESEQASVIDSVQAYFKR